MSETYLGKIESINGTKIFVAVDPSITSFDRTIDGKTYRIGQVGSFIRVPQAKVNLYGIVYSAGTKETAPGTKEPGSSSATGETARQRTIEVQLLGEAEHGGKFVGGISVLPIIGDEAHLGTLQDISLIYEETVSASQIPVGQHVAAQTLTAYMSVDKLATRHLGIFGSTGSGKSNCVAMLLRRMTSETYPNAQVVVIDPHGEYQSALSGQAKVISIRDPENPLYIPYWALTYDELAWFLVDRSSVSESEQDKVLRDKIYDEKKRNAGAVKTGAVEEVHVSADSPIPFDIKRVWYDLYFNEHATFWERGNMTKVAYRPSLTGEAMKGNVEQVIPPIFEAASTGENPPYASPRKCGMGTYLNKMMIRLKDHNFDFLLRPGPYDGKQADLNDLMASWLGHDKPLTIFNLEGVPFEIMDLVVGVVTKILYQMVVWGRNLQGMGRQRPLLLVYEEAHAYLSSVQNLQFVAGYSRTAAKRIFKEGRKYGIGSIVVSQRPSELDPTIISQCGTLICLRLTNTADQSIVAATMPDTLVGMTSLLPGLRVGEAIITGEAVKIPSRVRLPLIEPRLKSSDAEPAKQWSKGREKDIPYSEAINAWRKQKY